MVIRQQTIDIFSLPTVGVTKLRQSYYNESKCSIYYSRYDPHVTTTLRGFVLKILLRSWVFFIYIYKNLKTSSKELIGESVAVISRNLIEIYI